MKKRLIFVLLVLPVLVVAQKNGDSLMTSIGWEIYEGDSIQLKSGTRDNGRFKYVQTAGAFGSTYEATFLPSMLGNRKYVVTKIKDQKGVKIPLIVIRRVMGMEDRFAVDIENAILSGEVVIPEKYRKTQIPFGASVADELFKLKKLCDEGILTKEEFDAQKKKLLDK